MTPASKRNTGIALVGALLVSLAGATTLWATPLAVDSFSLQISEDISNYNSLSPSLQSSLRLVAQDRPNFTITNTSTTSSITAFYMTMGNSSYSFGSLIFSPNVAEPTVDTFLPGAAPGLHANSNFVSMTYSNFVPDLAYDFRVNIDRVADGGVSLTNYRAALAGGTDPSQWAVVNVAFSDGVSLHEVITPSDISGTAANTVYSYFYCPPSVPPIAQIAISAQTTPVTPATPTSPVTLAPEPTSWALAALGVVFMGLARLRRRRAI
jgi:hypothetical protein